MSDFKPHVLQEVSPNLLTALYADKRLAATPAMVAVGNNRYPEMADIVKTLEHYKEVDLVVDFVKQYASEIADAKAQIERSELPKQDNENLPIVDEEDTKIDFDEIYKRPIKQFSTSQIEEVFGKALAELTGRAYKVKINKMDFNPNIDSWSTDESLFELSIIKPVTRTLFSGTK